MRRLTAVILWGMASLVVAVQPAIAQSPQKITASEVVDAETLEAFVLYAKSHAEAFTDPNELAPYLHSISIEGDWKHGNTYLIIMLPDGTVFHHAGDISVNGKHLYDIEDARGNKVVQNLLAAANMGGGHVEYYWDNPAVEGDEDTPKVAYAVNYTSGIAGTTVVLIGGYYQDVSHASATPFDPFLIPPPDVTAADVVDRETLKAFVQGTGNRYLKAIEQVGLDVLQQNQDLFREEGGPYRQGSVYFFVFTTDGYVYFHGADRSVEHRFVSSLDRVDINGVKFIRELINVAKAGGGYVEYYFDDPAIEGDEDIGSPKVSYAELVVFRDGEYIVGAGFYKDLKRAVLNITLTQNDQPVADATVEFSRSIAGRAPEYQWQGTTDAEGRTTIEIQSDSDASGYYLARAKDADGNTLATWNSIPINSGEPTTLSLPIGDRAQMAMQDLVLHPNIPNPFNPSTQIAYQIPETGPVSLAIYNTLGQQVRVLVQNSQAPGQYRVTWDGKNEFGREVSSGVYIYRLAHSRGVIIRRLLLVK